MPDHSSSILFFSANPNDTSNTNNELECAFIQEIVNRKNKEHGYELIYHPGVNKLRMEEAIIDQGMKYISIFHFSGHGTKGGNLILEEEELSIFELKDLIACKSCDQEPQGIILNACYSKEEARELLELAPYVISMSAPIHNNDAQTFSTYFYKYLCAQNDWKRAFELSMNMKNLQKSQIIHCLSRDEAEEDLPQKALRNQNIQQSLWKFDFRDQIARFFQFQDRTASVCLIQGSAQFGHEWLQKRLLREAVEKSNLDLGNKKPLIIGAKHTFSSVSDMLDILEDSDLYHTSFLNNSSFLGPSKNELCQILKGILKKRSIIIIVEKAENLLASKLLGDFLSKIWLPICDELNQKLFPHHLLLFFLENNSPSNISQLIHTHASSIILPELTPFKHLHVDEWLKEIASHREMCKKYEDETGNPLQSEIENLFISAKATQDADGNFEAVPQKFLMKLCKKHGQKYNNMTSY